MKPLTTFRTATLSGLSVDFPHALETAQPSFTMNEAAPDAALRFSKIDRAIIDILMAEARDSVTPT